MDNVTITFKESMLHFWLESKLTIDNRFVIIERPKTSFFGLIPMGKEEKSIPLNELSNLETDQSYKMGDIVIGAITIATMGFGVLLPLPWGVKKLDNGLRHSVTYRRHGEKQSISVPFFEKEKIKPLREALYAGMANEIDQTSQHKFL
ncbi:MAG: hypothetical protein JJU16_05370 [Alkalibacterium sp.]|nr:hypothetical protein [Alkalibacterium sp.]